MPLYFPHRLLIRRKRAIDALKAYEILHEHNIEDSLSEFVAKYAPSHAKRKPRKTRQGKTPS